MGAENEIRDALTNLVLNAVDAMPSGGTLTFRSRIAREQVIIEVTDTDTGIGQPRGFRELG